MRRYNRWGGNPKGTPEDPIYCVVEVPERGRGCLFYQCCHKRGKGPGGLYCGLHASLLSKGRRLDVPEDK